MKLTSEQLNRFKELYKSCFGIELSDEEALDKGLSLLHMMRAIYKPIPKPEP